MLLLHVKDVSKVLVEKHVEWVSFFMEEGQVTIYAGHEPIMGRVFQGFLKYKLGKDIKSIEILEGFVHVTNEKVVILI